MLSKRRRPANRLVIFSPLPPLENGIADYAGELIPLLARVRDTTVVIDDHAPEPSQHRQYAVIRLNEYVARDAEFRDADHLYQVGNNPDHVYLLPWLSKRPGVVVLHDVSLHHLVDQATLRYGDIAAYRAVLELEYGAAGKVLGEQFERHRWRGRSMFFELPLTRELLGRARGVIVHSLYAANKVAAQQPDVPVTLVRHHVAQSALQVRHAGARDAARRQLGISDDTVLLVSLGFVTRAKQIETVLQFLHDRRADMPPVRYIIAGQDSPQDFDVRSLIVSLQLSDIVEITGYVDEPAFYRCIAASDIIVNLRYPSGGETSGTLIRALGAGACVVVNDIGSFAEYPDDVCAKVPVCSGVSSADFERVMWPLVTSPAKRRSLCSRAYRYMRETHSIEESVRLYLQVLDRYGDRPVLPLAQYSRRGLLTAARREALLRDMPSTQRARLPLWAAEGVMPCRVEGDLDRVLLVGGQASHAALLEQMFGYPARAIDFVAMPRECLGTGMPGRRRTHGLAVLELDVANAGAMLAAMATRFNDRLTIDACLVLTLVHEAAAVSGDHITAARNVLEACGFAVEQVLRSRETLSFALDVSAARDNAQDPAGDAIVMRARKISEFISPRVSIAWDALTAAVP